MFSTDSTAQTVGAKGPIFWLWVHQINLSGVSLAIFKAPFSTPKNYALGTLHSREAHILQELF